MRAFWPYVKGKPFCFGVVATDVDGRPVDLSMPLIFVGQQETDEGWANSMVPDDIAEAYRTGTWPSLGSSWPGSRQQQLIAYAQSDRPTTRASRPARSRSTSRSRARACTTSCHRANRASCP